MLQLYLGNLYFNSIESGHIGDAGVKAISKALEKNNKISQLSLCILIYNIGTNKFETRGSEAIAQMIDSNSMIIQLYLCKDFIFY